MPFSFSSSCRRKQPLKINWIDTLRDHHQIIRTKGGARSTCSKHTNILVSMHIKANKPPSDKDLTHLSVGHVALSSWAALRFSFSPSSLWEFLLFSSCFLVSLVSQISFLLNFPLLSSIWNTKVSLSLRSFLRPFPYSKQTSIQFPSQRLHWFFRNSPVTFPLHCCGIHEHCTALVQFAPTA